MIGNLTAEQKKQFAAAYEKEHGESFAAQLKNAGANDEQVAYAESLLAPPVKLESMDDAAIKAHEADITQRDVLDFLPETFTQSLPYWLGRLSKQHDTRIVLTSVSAYMTANSLAGCIGARNILERIIGRKVLDTRPGLGGVLSMIIAEPETITYRVFGDIEPMTSAWVDFYPEPIVVQVRNG